MDVGLGMEIDVIFRPGCRVTTAVRLRTLAEEILKRAPSGCEQACVLLTGDEEICTLNQRFRGLNRPTDVLSFPAREGGLAENGYLGDVVISVETARRQARPLQRTTRQEIDLLLVHGLLHLLGYDHETDDGEMERLQAQLTGKLLQSGSRRRGHRRTPDAGLGNPEG